MKSILKNANIVTALPEDFYKFCNEKHFGVILTDIDLTSTSEILGVVVTLRYLTTTTITICISNQMTMNVISGSSFFSWRPDFEISKFLRPDKVFSGSAIFYTKFFNSTRFFYKQHFYKQHQAKISKESSKW